ncbi:hypothetical protein ABZ419_21835 [Streptomyces cinnamoneus]|uniref:hypothetical protein n=1 Tax=Streptomyces cinnamoneus TaxID=53446 RepID=UPI0033E52BAF
MTTIPSARAGAAEVGDEVLDEVTGRPGIVTDITRATGFYILRPKRGYGGHWTCDEVNKLKVTRRREERES